MAEEVSAFEMYKKSKNPSIKKKNNKKVSTFINKLIFKCPDTEDRNEKKNVNSIHSIEKKSLRQHSDMC